jgi:hypothetical protein
MQWWGVGVYKQVLRMQRWFPQPECLCIPFFVATFTL